MQYIFTFHYVSIKSYESAMSNVAAISFTFHYVSIKSVLLLTVNECILYLHSTMFLLNQAPFKENLKEENNLHSTMFLLNP